MTETSAHMDDIADINKTSTFAFPFGNEHNSISPLNSLDDMDVDVIANYIDDKYHNITSTIWTCRLLFVGKTTKAESTEMDVLQFIVATQLL